MDVLTHIKNKITLLDGGMGTLLFAAGMKAGERPEQWNLSHPEEITKIIKSYFDAGSNIVNACTFGANALHYNDRDLEEVIEAALTNAKNARAASDFTGEKYITMDIGPSGKLLRPYGDLDFEDAVSAFKKSIALGAKHGADLVFIETMNDSYETKAALLAAKECCDLPVFVSNAYSEDGKLMTGASPAAMVAMLEGMGADAIGVNCSLGPEALFPVVEEYLEYASVPVLFKPNAGLPSMVDGKTVYDLHAPEFAEDVMKMLKKGVRIAGGCCGTTPEYIKTLREAVSNMEPLPIEEKHHTMVSSYTHAVDFSNEPLLIGERINPTGKKRFRQALIDKDMDYILNVAVSEQEDGAHILDVNVGIPDIDEPAVLKETVFEVQGVTNLPLQIDTSDPAALNAAMRVYNGKALVNSVNGKKDSMDAVFPLVKKYGGVVVGLTLDEDGIPETAEGRIAIAKKILDRAKEYGIDKKDIIFDTLTMTVSADPKAAKVTLDALSYIKNEMGCHTVLGVSNVSFGLPERNLVNSTFFSMALHSGLSSAIMNPQSLEMKKAYFSFRALTGRDENFADYIDFAANIPILSPVSGLGAGAAGGAGPQASLVSGNAGAGHGEEFSSELARAVVKGLKDAAREATKEMIKTKDPLLVVNDEVIPALNIVGQGFEAKTIYLPQLLMSAEAAKESFEVVKSVMADSGKGGKTKCPVVIATVHGDIHDIGKNIVKLILENYGFNVIDLGKDVEPETILEAVTENKAPLCGLSALMTTTVPAMEKTVKLIQEKAPFCKICVGGAVLTEEFANTMGADRYVKDAMDTVRYAEEINSGL